MNYARAFAALIPPPRPIDDCACWSHGGTGASPDERLAHRWGHAQIQDWSTLVSCPLCWFECARRSVVIVKRLPERDGEFEYQIKNLAEADERVVRESQLRPSPWHRSGRPAGYRQ